jgi:predicted nucleic-acid-binding Zn-ribbon protein
MKSSKQCPKCHSLDIGVLEVAALPHGTEVLDFRPQPVGVIRRRSWPVSVFVPVGRLEAWICTECGYYETYIKEPSSISFEELHGFRWGSQSPKNKGPYR